jgi:hypothetical protein
MKLPQIQIVISGTQYDNTFNDDIRIERTDLDTEFSTQAEKYAYYAFLAEMAEHIYELGKAELEQLYAKVDFQKRQAADAVKSANPQFKYTEKMCENEVLTDGAYVLKRKEVLEAKLLAGQLKVCSMAFAQRREMLISLGASQRNQMLPHRLNEEQTRLEQAKSIVAANAQTRRGELPVTEPPPGRPEQPLEPEPMNIAAPMPAGRRRMPKSPHATT